MMMAAAFWVNMVEHVLAPPAVAGRGRGVHGAVLLFMVPLVIGYSVVTSVTAARAEDSSTRLPLVA